MCDMPKLTAAAKHREKEYQAEEDHRTLTRAAEVRSDSSRMAGVVRHHQKQTMALQRTSKALFGRGGKKVAGMGRRSAGRA